MAAHRSMRFVHRLAYPPSTFLFLVVLAATASCHRGTEFRFWFDNLDLVSIDTTGAHPAPLPDPGSCAIEPESWELVPSPTALPSGRGAFTVWRNLKTPSTINVDTLEVLVHGQRIPKWKRGTTPRKLSYHYSQGGFLQRGLYLATPQSEIPSTLEIECRYQPTAHERERQKMRQGLPANLADLIELVQVGNDSRLALPVAANAVVKLRSPVNQGTNIDMAFACPRASEQEAIEIITSKERKVVTVEEPDKWMPLLLKNSVGDLAIRQIGTSRYDCFVSDPRWVATSKQQRPNIVVVIVDGLRSDVAGDPEIMPYLYNWSQDVLLFSQARVTAPWTRPSVASLLTGRYPRQHGLETEGRNILATEIETLPEVLRSHGYVTASFSANPWLGPSMGLDQGFSRMVTLRDQAEHLFFEASEWSRSVPGPSFSVIFLMDTHYPYRHQQSFDRTSSLEGSTLDVGSASVSDSQTRPRNLAISDQDISKTRGLYLENAAYVDQMLGDFLQQQSRDENTIIAVTADHGEAFGEHRDFFHGWNLYEELVHVPLILRSRDLAPGVRSDPVSLRQLAPTLLELVGVSTDEIPARTLSTASNNSPVFFSTRFRDMSLDSVLVDHWKFIDGRGKNDCELYDLSVDPGETVNLCSVDRQRATELSALLKQYQTSPRQATSSMSGEQPSLDELESLGYLGQ